MKWSWRIGRLFGINIFVHATFFILLAWIALISYLQTQNTTAAIEAAFFIVMVFGTVVMHELCHALTARQFGIGTKDIILLPIGGVARMERLPEKPLQGLLVSLAGPALNILLAGILFLYLYSTQGPEGVAPSTFMKGSFLSRFMWINITLALFNLLPAYPMDGGRILRSLLTLWMEPLKATRIAAGLGQFMALLFGIFGLLFNPFLVLIAVFIWLGAAEETAVAQMKSGLSGISVFRLMITHFETLTPEEPLSRAVEHVLSGFQQDFPVIRSGRLAGMLTRKNLMQALAEHGPQIPVSQAMQTECPTADPAESLEAAFARIQTSEAPSLPVVQDGKVIGMLTLENLAEFLMFQGALKNRSIGEQNR